MAFKQQERPSLYPFIDIDLIKNPSRFYAFPLIGGFVKIIMLIPIAVELGLLQLAYFSILLVNSLAVLFTGRYWRISYDLGMGLLRLEAKTAFFMYGLTNKYPGFSLSTIDFGYKIDYPKQPNQAFAFPLLGGLIRMLLLIPFTIYMYVIEYGAFIGTIFGSFVVLFTGRYAESIYEISIDSLRITQAMKAYMYGFSDTYPTFKISMNHKWIKIALIIAGILALFGNYGNSFNSAANSKQNNSYYNTKQIQPLQNNNTYYGY
jgi:hypothetical protein